MMQKLIIVIMVVILASDGETVVSGNVGGITFGPSGNPYIVDGDSIMAQA